MFNNCRSWVVGIAAVSVLLAAGCPKKNVGAGRTAEPASPAGAAPVEKSPAAKPEEPPAPPTIPKVSMSDETRAGCLVQVGDAMPAAELVDFDGQKHTLESQYGKRLTVLCFWTIGEKRRAQLVAQAALQDLAKEIAGPFEAEGVRVVAVNVGDAAADARRHIDEAGVELPCLSDAKGELFARLAKDRKMPRVYLLDADGKILWFDVEYSRSSREDLTQGIRVALGKL